MGLKQTSLRQKFQSFDTMQKKVDPVSPFLLLRPCFFIRGEQGRPLFNVPLDGEVQWVDTDGGSSPLQPYRTS